jgi:hypothetical protein
LKYEGANMKTMKLLVAILLVSVVQIKANQPTDDKEKVTTVKGAIYRSDRNHPVAKAVIILLDERKSEKKDDSVQTQTDENGNYNFEKVKAGKYIVSIRTWHKSQEEVPCQLLIAKTKDKDSAVLMMEDKERFVEQIFIKGFSVKGDKEIVRDFDIACKALFEK